MTISVQRPLLEFEEAHTSIVTHTLSILSLSLSLYVCQTPDAEDEDVEMGDDLEEDIDDDDDEEESDDEEEEEQNEAIQITGIKREG